MPRIDEMPEYRAKLPKSVHDLSHKFGFTATVAHLMPIFHDFVNPGETIELGVGYNLRTQPLQSAAMVDIKSHVEYFFVPIQLLFEPFGGIFYNISDNYSSNYPYDESANPLLAYKFPVLDFNDLLLKIGSDGSQDVGDETWECSIYRMFDLLGYNNTDLNRATSRNRNPNVFPYPLLAYNCIYQYYYRLDNRERFNQTYFNWDKYYNTSVVQLTAGQYMELTRLRYRPKDSDYFTDVKVSPIVDTLNLNVKDDFQIAKQWLTRSVVDEFNVLSSGSYGGSGGTDDADAPMGSNFNDPSTELQRNFGFRASVEPDVPTFNGMDINTANIRAMFATEKLWSITGRARKHYDDQTLAHFGFNVPHDVKHEISCFGHDRGAIHIGEVISTADTENSALGEIAGKGYGNMQASPHKFTAPCHGVVMAIMSFVPDVTYGGTYGKYNVVTSPSDLYQPEYDHLGMQPLFGYEGDPEYLAGWNLIIGWQYRYEQWKRRYNRVSKAFTGSGNLDSWMLDFYPTRFGQDANTPLDEVDSMYIHHPAELNQIMLVNYIQSLPDLHTKVYDGDPFVVDAYIHCKKVSTMSDYSLPRLDA